MIFNLCSHDETSKLWSAQSSMLNSEILLYHLCYNRGIINLRRQFIDSLMHIVHKTETSIRSDRNCSKIFISQLPDKIMLQHWKKKALPRKNWSMHWPKFARIVASRYSEFSLSHLVASYWKMHEGHFWLYWTGYFSKRKRHSQSTFSCVIYNL